MMEFERITTRGGDTGNTSIADGSRRPKDDMLIEVLGEVDELHAALGLPRAGRPDPREQDDVEWIQRCLIRIGGMLAVPPSHESYGSLDLIDDEAIERIESWEKDLMNRVDLPPMFVTYGESESGARADLARAVCRRCERRMVRIIRERRMTDLAPAQRFLNRLSDWLFVKARALDAAGDV